MVKATPAPPGSAGLLACQACGKDSIEISAIGGGRPAGKEACAPRSGFAWSVAATFCVLLLAGCRQAPSTASPHLPPPAVSELVATLEDEVRDLPGEKIAWSTYWKLCWAESPGAQAYELQTVTGEGTSPRLRRQRERCFRLQAAAGENHKAQGLLNRELQLALQQGQLAYRVRTVLSDGRVSEWSPVLTVGKATDFRRPASRPAR